MPRKKAAADGHELKVIYAPPDDLVPAPYNPRQMSDEAFAKLKRGIVEFGLVDPLIARAEDHLMIGGHQRLRAAKELGLDVVPVVYLRGLSDDQTAALNILLNNPSAQGDWDMPKLAAVLSELDATGYDATLTGFDMKQLEDILTWSTDGGAASEDEIAEKYAIIVQCADEDEQAKLIQRFLKEGLECRALLS